MNDYVSKREMKFCKLDLVADIHKDSNHNQSKKKSNANMLWQHPSPYLTRLDAFRRRVNQKYGTQLQTYDELHKWSVDEPEAFNRELWEFCGVVHSTPPNQVAVGLEKMWPRPQWFPGARLNYTENILSTGLSAHPDAIAVSACREGGTSWRHLSWKQLRDRTEQWVSALKHAGIGKGDRIASKSSQPILILGVTVADMRRRSGNDELHRVGPPSSCSRVRWCNILIHRSRHGGPGNSRKIHADSTKDTLC